MKKVILLLGGARSGKSCFAVEYARNHEGKVLFVATAAPDDEDMRQRIEKHKHSRPSEWQTLEACRDIGSQVEAAAGDAQLIIIDCITMLINNVFSRFDEKSFEHIDETVLEQAARVEMDQLQLVLDKVQASVLIISNEVGYGIVPDNRIGRLYRDLLGKVNQSLAARADEVYLLAAGIPLRIKPQTIPGN